MPPTNSPISRHARFPRLFTPITIGPPEAPRTFSHRFLMNPLYTGTEEAFKRNSSDFFAVQAEFYGMRARHGAKLIVSGAVSPSWLGRWYPKAQTLTSYEAADGLRQVTDAVHKEGGTILMQVYHAGRSACSPLCIAPSPIASPVAPYKWSRPLGIPTAAISYIGSEFERAAALAHRAGFDGIELPVCHGSLLHNFVVPSLNQRTDEWGGTTIEERMAFVMEVLRHVKDRIGEATGSRLLNTVTGGASGAVTEALTGESLEHAKKAFLVSCRLSIADLLPLGQGNDMTAICRMAEMLVESGLVDILTTSVGHNETTVPVSSSHVPRAPFAVQLKRVRDHLHAKNLTHVPVVSSHRVNNPTLAEELLEGGVCDMVGIARPLLADPCFIENCEKDDHLSSMPCIACNKCFDTLFKAQRIQCAINPLAGFELERLPLKAVPFPKNIVVVGAGPTGITCALTLSRRGHKVILYEQHDEIGGQLNMAKVIPGKEEYYMLLEHWTQELKRSNVEVRLRSEFVREDITAGHQLFHAMVLCCGSVPREISSHRVIGAENKKVVGFWDVLARRTIPGRKIGILGNGAIAHDVASYLVHDHRVSRDVAMFCTEWGVEPNNGAVDLDKQASPRRQNGRDIILFQKANHAAGLYKSKGWAQRRALKAHGVSIFTNCLFSKIDDLGIHFTTPNPDNKQLVLDCDTIVWAQGMLPHMTVSTWVYEWVRDGAQRRGQLLDDFGIYMAGSCRHNATIDGSLEQDLHRAVHEGFQIGANI